MLGYQWKKGSKVWLGKAEGIGALESIGVQAVVLSIAPSTLLIVSETLTHAWLQVPLRLLPRGFLFRSMFIAAIR
jgi:hypothetical protein